MKGYVVLNVYTIPMYILKKKPNFFNIYFILVYAEGTFHNETMSFVTCNLII